MASRAVCRGSAFVSKCKARWQIWWPPGSRERKQSDWRDPKPGDSSVAEVRHGLLYYGAGKIGSWCSLGTPRWEIFLVPYQSSCSSGETLGRKKWGEFDIRGILCMDIWCKKLSLLGIYFQTSLISVTYYVEIVVAEVSEDRPSVCEVTISVHI